MRSYRCISLLILLAVSMGTQTIRQAAGRDGILIGAAVNAHYLSEPAYTTTLARGFNLLEPEDTMKWSVLRPDEKSFDFQGADRIVAFAELHRMNIRGHNLVWANHNPDWLVHGNFPPDQLSTLLCQHIERVLGHFRGKVFAWDVVNEAYDGNGNFRHSIWYDQPGIGLAGEGTAYIAQAFRWAHAVGPMPPVPLPCFSTTMLPQKRSIPIRTRFTRWSRISKSAECQSMASDSRCTYPI